MNKFKESIQKEAHTTLLSDAERASIRARIEDAMRTSPAYTESPLFAVPIRTPFVFSTRLVYALATLILVIGVSGGTTFAAGSSLPGDFLYSIKTDVNEPVFGAFAVTKEAKATWHAEVATERLKEAAALSSEGRLTASTSAELATAFTEHAVQAESIANSLAMAEPASAAKLATAFSATIGVQSSAILAAGGGNESRGNSLASSDLVHAVITQKVQSDKGELAIADTDTSSTAEPVSPTTSVVNIATTNMQSPVAITPPAAKMMMTLSASATEPQASTAPVILAKSVTIVMPNFDALFAGKNFEVTQFFETNRALFSASTTAYAESELGDIKLVPIQVEADRTASNDAAAIHDLRVGIARINRLILLLHGEAAHGVQHSASTSATTSVPTSSPVQK